MKKLRLAILLTIAVVGLASAAYAGPVTLVDRGLPTANLNNVSGANRSNVAWAFGGPASDYWLVGDTFQNTSSQLWTIDTITMWTVGSTSSAVLWGGLDASTVALASTGTTITSGETYSDSQIYQGSSGSYIGMQRVDFAVNITLQAGQTYMFFLDGTGGAAGVPFVHASNALLSGSPQQGSDNLMLYANVFGGAFDPFSVGSWTSLGDGWDKASDVNVLVSGSVPDGGTSVALLGFGLVAIEGLRRRFAGRRA